MMVMAPLALFSCTFAIRSVASVQELIASSSCVTSASVAPSRASRPDMPVVPAMAEAKAAFSVSVISAALLRSCSSTSRRPSMFPETSVREIPYSSIAALAALGGSARRLKSERSVVPACDALIPWLAMRPAASATSSMLYPRAPARGAAYLKDSPSISTLVLELVAVAARTSAKCCTLLIPVSMVSPFAMIL